MQGATNFVSNLVAISRDRLIASTRLVLALGGIAAVYLDTGEPRRSGSLAVFVLLGLYVALALVCLLLVKRTLNVRAVYAIHIAEAALIAVLAATTEGAASPFFVLFTFVMFVGTLRWDVRGAIATGLFLCAVLFVMSTASVLTGSAPLEVDRIILRNIWLPVAAILFAYVGAYFAYSRKRLAELAAWPYVAAASGEYPPLEPLLEHAAKVLGTRRAVAVWSLADEPFTYFCCWANGQGECGQFPPGFADELLPGAGRADSFFWPEDGDKATRGFGDAYRRLAERFGIERAVTSAFHQTHCEGRCFFLDMQAGSEEDLRLSEIAAFRIGTEINSHYLQKQHARDIRYKERLRLSHDLHDNVLQSLTAVAMKLDDVTGSVPQGAKQSLSSLHEIVTAEHQRIRSFVDQARESEAAQSFVRLLATLNELADSQKRLWNCEIEVEVSPPDIVLDRHSYEQVRLILQESLANAVRHGGASRLRWIVSFLPFEMQIRVVNNGRKIPIRTRSRPSRDR